MEAETPAVEEEVEAVCEAVEAVTIQPTEEEVGGGGWRCYEVWRCAVFATTETASLLYWFPVHSLEDLGHTIGNLARFI